MSGVSTSWAPGRWWQVLAPDGSVWCGTSDESEARSAMRPGDLLQRQYRREDIEWRNVEGGFEDTIVDDNDVPITPNCKVILGDLRGTVSAVASTSDREGETPIVFVDWGGEDPDDFPTSIRDYRHEGPSGPFTYVVEDITVER